MKALITFVCVFNTLLCFSQVRQNIYFLKNNGKRVNEKDSADFIRFVKEPDSGSVFFKVMEYYPNGKPKRITESSTVDPLTIQGRCITYYSSGVKESILNYNAHVLKGDQYYFYPNGKLSQYRSYPGNSYTQPTLFGGFFMLMGYSDTTGKALVANGNGYYSPVKNAFKEDINLPERFEGNIVDGLKNGDWKIYYEEDSLRVTETYEKGRLVMGKTVTANGQIFTYTKAESIPEFKGDLNKFISKNLRYPAYEQRNAIEGRVNVTFIIERDGSLSDVKEARGSVQNAALIAEAIRIIKSSPKWQPGIQNGRPVRVSYTLPVSFNLSN